MTRGDAVWRVYCADRVCSILLRGLVKVSVTGKRGKLGMVQEGNKPTTSVIFV